MIESTPGWITGFDQFAIATGAFPAHGPLTLGSLTFHVVSPIADAGIDLIAGIFEPGIDSIETNLGGRTANFNGTLLPEPASALLIGLGGVALDAASRRRH